MIGRRAAITGLIALAAMPALPAKALVKVYSAPIYSLYPGEMWVYEKHIQIGFDPDTGECVKLSEWVDAAFVGSEP